MDEKIKLIMTLGAAEHYAEFLAQDRTLAQVREWVRKAAGKEVPLSYFKALHRENHPVKAPEEIRRDAEAALAESADPSKDERRRRRDRVYLTLRSPEHPWQVDDYATREALLLEFGFHIIAAGEMARSSTLAEIIQWIDASEDEANPWVFVRQQVTWNLSEPAWPDSAPPRQEGPTDMRLIRRWHGLGTTLKLPNGRIVTHRPCPAAWAKYTSRLRDVLGREPWSDYSEAGGTEVKIGITLKDVVDAAAKPNPADRAKERVKAILDEQAKQGKLAKSLGVLRGGK